MKTLYGIRENEFLTMIHSRVIQFIILWVSRYYKNTKSAYLNLRYPWRNPKTFKLRLRLLILKSSSILSYPNPNTAHKENLKFNLKSASNGKDCRRWFANTEIIFFSCVLAIIFYFSSVLLRPSGVFLHSFYDDDDHEQMSDRNQCDGYAPQVQMEFQKSKFSFNKKTLCYIFFVCSAPDTQEFNFWPAEWNLISLHQTEI